MARTYLPEPETDSPGPIDATSELRDFAPAGFAHTEASFAVPTVDSEGRRRMVLDYAPRSQSGFTLTVAAASRVLIPYGEAPGTGEVAVDWARGILEFNAADQGETVAVSYQASGSVALAGDLFRIVEAIVDLRTRVTALEP